MKIGALQKVSLIDYPCKISCIVFTQGCNFRCGYCHNPQLVIPQLFEKEIDEKIIFDYLSKRKDIVEGVVITGGEPTIHKDLPDFIRKINGFGYSTKLDTNGSNPAMLKTLIRENLVDFIAMDLKTTFDKYDELCGVKIDTSPIKESINLIMEAAIGKQFRITIFNRIHNAEEITMLADSLGIELTFQDFVNRKQLVNKNINWLSL